MVFLLINNENVAVYDLLEFISDSQVTWNIQHSRNLNGREIEFFGLMALLSKCQMDPSKDELPNVIPSKDRKF